MGLKLTGYIELSGDELHQAIDRFIREHYGYSIKSVEVKKDGVVATIGESIDPQRKGFQRTHDSLLGKEFIRKWNGLYASVGEVIEAERKRKKKFISFEDLRTKLLAMEDLAKNKMFVKDGEELPMSVIKQRLAPSQLVRQAKRQPTLKGVKYDRAGLKI